LLLPIHRFNRPGKIIPGACFYFNEDKGIAVTTDYVDLTAVATAKVAVETLVAVSAQKAAGQFLTALLKLKMRR
jgi:hypothetical protein